MYTWAIDLLAEYWEVYGENDPPQSLNSVPTNSYS